jgi:hypothetical protein
MKFGSSVSTRMALVRRLSSELPNLTTNGTWHDEGRSGRGRCQGKSSPIGVRQPCHCLGQTQPSPQVMVGGGIAPPTAIRTGRDSFPSHGLSYFIPTGVANGDGSTRGLASVAVMSPLAAHLCMLLYVEGRSRIWRLRISFVK